MSARRASRDLDLFTPPWGFLRLLLASHTATQVPFFMKRLIRLMSVLVAFGFQAVSLAADSMSWMLEVQVRGARVEGMPLRVSDDQVYLLARDGQLWDFRPEEARDFRKTAGRFTGFSAAQMRAELERELGGRLDITGTGHYLVAHPPNHGAQWAERFEGLYRSFYHYCSVRGMRLKEPAFPLVAIVWPNQRDFLHYCISHGGNPGPNVLGYYSPVTNRIVLYDSAVGPNRGEDWRQNAATIVHEATHQTAFNTGVHSRFGLPPRWVAEGLGMLWEARGIYDAPNYPTMEDRINADRLRAFRSYAAAGRPVGAFIGLIESDRQFGQRAAEAYAESWAFTFFLSETEPRKYTAYLARTADRPAFEQYTSAERLADFKAVFGDNFRMMDANFLRFIATLK